MGQYLLGTGARELERLERQDRLWGPVTEAFLDRLEIGAGQVCLDVGAGPGLVSERLSRRVGPAGRVTALDPSRDWQAHLTRRIADGELANVRLSSATLAEARSELQPSSFDLVFVRWVLSFLPDLEQAIADLARLLRPGGVLAIQDYNHEGVSVFPESEGFRAMIRATREAYVRTGGDPWVAARLRGPLRRAGLEVCDWNATVLSGPSDSAVARWLDEFFRPQCDNLGGKGDFGSEDKERFLREWDERRADPDAVFFSPIVLDVAARKPAR